MTWTYSGNPSSTPVDEQRFLVGDVDNDRQLLQNEEIQYWLDKLGPAYGDSPLMSAAYLADTIAARFAAEVSQSGDGVNVAADQLQEKFTTLAVSLREQHARLAGVGAGPYMGINDLTNDPYQRPGWASLGQHDNPEAGTQDTADRYYWPQVPEGSW